MHCSKKQYSVFKLGTATKVELFGIWNTSEFSFQGNCAENFQLHKMCNFQDLCCLILLSAHTAQAYVCFWEVNAANRS